jgi:hypothetical protein
VTTHVCVLPNFVRQDACLKRVRGLHRLPGAMEFVDG